MMGTVAASAVMLGIVAAKADALVRFCWRIISSFSRIALTAASKVRDSSELRRSTVTSNSLGSPVRSDEVAMRSTIVWTC